MEEGNGLNHREFQFIKGIVEGYCTRTSLNHIISWSVAKEEVVSMHASIL